MNMAPAMKTIRSMTVVTSLLALLLLAGCGKDESSQATSVEQSKATTAATSELTDEQIENIVRRSYQYVAMYNVNNKFAIAQGWNKAVADTQLKDHTMTDIARPNNDTLYISVMLERR